MAGKTASLVAKYRPRQPIMTLVVPYLKREKLKWVLEGRSTARQALITYGLMPVLAAPAPSGECVGFSQSRPISLSFRFCL